MNGQWSTSRPCIIVFVKAPRRGSVKTRLAKRLADHVVQELYRHFVCDTLAAATACRVPIRVFFSPRGAEKAMRCWLGNRYHYFGQEGQGLGEKMARAFERTFEDGFTKALLIGTDLPDLPPRIITEGLDSLDRVDAVVGPAVDGGFYLIGFRTETYFRDAFEGISWSTDRVYAATRDRIRSAGLAIHTLPKWRDVDTFQDLANLAVALERGASGAAHTAQYMRSIGMVRRYPQRS